MKKARFIIIGIVCLLLLKWGWDHRPWKEIVFQGYVEGEYVRVSSPVAGRLETLFVQRGESVVANQPLYSLEKDPEQQQQSEAAARAHLAEQNAQRNRELIKSKSISDQEYDKSESEFKTATENLSEIQWKLDQKNQSAKESSYVQDTFFVKGEWVKEGVPVVSLLPPGNIKIRFFVDSASRAGLQTGQALQLRIFGGKQDLAATISYLSSEAEYTPPVIYSNDTRAHLTFMVEARPDPSSLALFKPGQPVEIVLK